MNEEWGGNDLFPWLHYELIMSFTKSHNFLNGPLPTDPLSKF